MAVDFSSWDGGQFPQAQSTTERVIQVYLALANEREPQGVTQIAQKVCAAKPSVHRILQHLVRYGLAERNAETRKYGLGARSYAIASEHLASDPLLEVSRPYMDYLSELTGETVTLCKRFGFHNVYIGLIESTKEMHISIPLGEETPLTVGANGLCELAFLDEESINLALSLPRHSYTDRTVTDEKMIRERLEQIRHDGYSITSGERVMYCAGASAPIRAGGKKHPVGAIGVAFLESRFPNINERYLSDEIRQVAHLIEQRLMNG